jgi:hypothetical protein
MEEKNSYFINVGIKSTSSSKSPLLLRKELPVAMSSVDRGLSNFQYCSIYDRKEKNLYPCGESYPNLCLCSQFLLTELSWICSGLGDKKVSDGNFALPMQSTVHHFTE